MAVATPELWRMRLLSALRAALACSIVGGVTLFGPADVRRLLSTFSSFSYVTTISIVLSDVGTTGDAVRGGWHVVAAMIPVFISSVACLWVVGPARFNSGLAAVAVAVSAFVVALPERTHLLTKRIAFGQLVVVYVGTVIHGAQAGFLMHPLRVLSSTAIGALAAVLAMLLPFPQLSSGEVRKLCGLYCKNAGERLDLLVEGFGVKTKAEALVSIAQAKSLSTTGTKLLQSIQRNLGGMAWERPWIRLVRPNYMGIGEKLQKFETTLRGMETALSCPSFVFGTMDEELNNLLKDLKAQAVLRLEQVKCSESPNATTAPEMTEGRFSNTWPMGISSITQESLQPSFFLHCMELLQYDLNGVFQNFASVVGDAQKTNKKEAIDLQSRGICGPKSTPWGILSRMWPTHRSFYFALKCSLTLGLAVFLGLTYNKQNGYWSGLTVAISFATERQAIFTVANARAQGTAMGSIYGVICCFILQRYEYLWLLPLLPWVTFTRFLVHSRMYGQAGGIAAALGALLILGRKNYGRPTEFANARITEACIGLLCFVTVEVIFNRTRAATLAKAEFSKSLEAVQDCIKQAILISKENLFDSSIYVALEEKLKNLKSHVSQLEKFIVEARFEPNFWFTPFQGACYDKLLKSLQKIVDILQFLVHEMKFLSLKSNSSGLVMKELQDTLGEEMELFNKNIGCSLRFMEKVTLLKSLKELYNKNQDLCDKMEKEGISPNDGCKALALTEEEVEKIMSSFCQHASEAMNRVYTNEDEATLRGQMALCFSSIGFCMECLMRETMEMERRVHGLLKLENPSIHMNLQEISLKINVHCT